MMRRRSVGDGMEWEGWAMGQDPPTNTPQALSQEATLGTTRISAQAAAQAAAQALPHLRQLTAHSFP